MIPSLGKNRDAPTPEERPRPPSTGRIRVADVAEPVRRTLLDILRKLGTPESDVIVATSPEETLALFKKHNPSLVFLELLGVQPEDGLEVIHEILDTGPEVRVVLVTAEPDDAPEVRAAIRAGVFAVIHKPLRHEKIRQVISDLETELGGVERLR